MDTIGKIVKPTSSLKWYILLNGKIGKTVKPTGPRKMVPMLKPGWPKIDANGKKVKPISAQKR